jgi:hypothetical protein
MAPHMGSDKGSLTEIHLRAVRLSTLFHFTDAEQIKLLTLNEIKTQADTRLPATLDGAAGSQCRCKLSVRLRFEMLSGFASPTRRAQRAD